MIALPKTTLRRRMKVGVIVLLGVILSSNGVAAPAASERPPRELNHRVFTATDGAPSDIYALAQTADGTLWIGGRTGLTRFDGVKFTPYPGPGEEPLQSNLVSSLIAAADGGLWIGFRIGGTALLKGGHLTRYDGPDGSVEAFAWDRDGSLWAAARLGLAHFTHTRWQIAASERALGAPYSLLVDRAGTLWVGTARGLFSRGVGSDGFREVVDNVQFGPEGSKLAASPDGTIWAAPANKLLRVGLGRGLRTGGPAVFSGISGGPLPGGPLLFDQRGNLWLADLAAKALDRIPASAFTDEHNPGVRPNQYSPVDEVGSEQVTSIVEDHEHNIWVGTVSSLHRFSQGNVVRDAAPPCNVGVNLAGTPIVAGEAGSLWMACQDRSGPYVNEIRDGKVVNHQITPDFDVAYRDLQRGVWFAGPSALGKLENGRILATSLPQALQGRPIQALVRDHSGAMWLSVSRRTLFRVLNGDWSEYGNLRGLPQEYPLIETSDSNGVLWFGYRNNQIARIEGSAVQILGAKHGLAVGTVMAILVGNGGLWVGGDLGFAHFDGHRFLPIHSASDSPFKGISGIVRARNGDLWLNGIAGIVHIPREEVERVIRDPTHPVNCEIYNYLDGVPGVASQLRPSPTAIETTDGRVWFSMTGGVVSIDVTRLIRNTVPPPVTIWSLTSGDKSYPNTGQMLHLPLHSTDLQIEYSAGSLTRAERVHFRYMLEGLDERWQEVGTRREALYTNLRPGNYTFRVTASNSDGVWNSTGASVRFAIPPAFYQTRWFYAFCALACAALLYALYRMRMGQMAAQVRGRLEARLAERERIARDLHDTLLQGMQGLIWRFHAAAQRIPQNEGARKMMEQSLDQADRLLEEGRDRVKDLRPTATDATELPQAIAAEGERFAQQHHLYFCMNVQGTPRALHPIVQEEGFLIAREALGNAFRHAAARRIEAEVAYEDTSLHIRIRDDGSGITHAVLAAGGKPGHFGLIGMRERASKLGAHLELWSKPGAGTEIELRVPANVAFASLSQSRPRGWRWPSKTGVAM
jgi:signal transduction histidine kinase/ligand-binding sensor domain-containing protein